MGTAPATAPALPEGLARRLGSLDPRWVLGGAMAICVGLMVWFAGDRSFAIDEWEFVVNRRDWTVEEVLRPSNAHLLAIPLVAYKGLLELFGADSHAPFTVLSIVLHLAIVALVYALAARRLGGWVALLPALLILFYGVGWEVMVSTAAMQNGFGLIFGLGALLLLDRHDLRGDIGASLLLVASLGSFTIGVAFAVAAAVRVVADRIQEDRPLSRLALVAVPVALYAAWYLWARRYDQSNLGTDSITALPANVFDQLGAIGAGVVGLFRQGDLIASVLGLALLALLLLRLRAKPVLGPAAWGALALLLTYLGLIALGIDEFRSPDASRYVYMGTIVLVVAAAELLDGIRIGGGWLIAALALLAVSLVSNIAQMRSGGDYLEREGALNRAELGAIELMRGSIDPTFVIESSFEEKPYPLRDLTMTAGDYYGAADDYGSPAMSEAELAAAPAEARAIADEIFAAAHGIAVIPGEPLPAAGPPPDIAERSNATVEPSGPCVVAEPDAATPATLVLSVDAGGAITFASDAPPQRIALRRYGDGFSRELTAPVAEGTIVLPPDAAPRPWGVQLTLAEGTKLCSATTAAEQG